jgi:hypothetical protein
MGPSTDSQGRKDVLIPCSVSAWFRFQLDEPFTTGLSRRWRERRGSLLAVMFRDVLGIQVWVIGFVLAIRTESSSQP